MFRLSFPVPTSRRLILALSLALALPLGFGWGTTARAAAPTSSSAAELLDARVEYTADYYLNSSNGHFHGTVIHAPGRERREFDTAGGHQTLLLRRDIDEASVLWPERKWYVTTSFNAVASLVGGLDGLLLDLTPVGQQVVGGERTTHYQVTGTSSGGAGGGGRFSGQMWFTGDGILMKAVGKVVFMGHETAVETGLTNLRRIKADPAAFVRPSDYKGLPIDISKLLPH